MGQFAGRVVIVTGATDGIGRETAIRFAAAGASVIVTGRKEAEGAETVARAAALGGDAVFFRQDISEEAGWAALMDMASARFGRLDVLVNNAGQFFVKPLADTTLADFDLLYRVNVEGCWLGIKHAMPAIHRSGGGAIVNVSSLMGQVGIAQGSAYCASKGAMTALTKAAALEGAPLGIRVNSLHPGVIWTKMLEDMYGDGPIRQFFIDETPLKQEGTPAFMADGILYLASDDARHVTGSELTIDGGRGAD